MEDISNKTLAILVSIAIVVGLVGLFTFSPRVFQTTGMAGTTQTGTTQLNITNVVSITLTGATINFGSGYVNTTASSCTMNSEGTNPSTCVGFDTISTGFILENDGNVNVSVTANSTTAATFISGTSPAYQFKSASSEASSCSAGAVASYTAFTASPQAVCTNFLYADSSDTLEIDIQVTVPDDASVGERSTSVVFTATEV